MAHSQPSRQENTTLNSSGTQIVSPTRWNPIIKDFSIGDLLKGEGYLKCNDPGIKNRKMMPAQAEVLTGY